MRVSERDQQREESFGSQETSKENKDAEEDQKLVLLVEGSRTEVRLQGFWSLALSTWPFFALRGEKCRTGLENVLL